MCNWVPLCSIILFLHLRTRDPNIYMGAAVYIAEDVYSPTFEQPVLQLFVHLGGGMLELGSYQSIYEPEVGP